MLVLLEFSVLRFLLFKFSVLGSSIARYGGSSFPFPLLVTVGSRSSLQTSFSNNWTLDFSPNIVSNTLPFYADDSCAPCFLQHLVPLLVVPTNFVPQKNKKTARVNTGLKKNAMAKAALQTRYSLFQVHFLYFFHILFVSLLKLLCCFILWTERGKFLLYLYL